MRRAVTINTKLDVVYRVVDGVSLMMDISWPKGRGPFPVIVCVHGGGWYKGDEDDAAIDRQRLAEAGYAAFAPAYRFAPPGIPGSHAPAPVEDMLACLDWIRAHAPTYAADPSRVGGLGASAGGHLIQMLAVQEAIKAGVSWSGPSYLPLLDGTSGGPRVENYVGASYATAPNLWEAASPRPSVTSATAPLFLVNSDQEAMPLNQATGMADVLATAGVSYRLRILAGTLHGGAYRDQVWDESVLWLRHWV